MFEYITVELYTTLDCNLACPHCFQDKTQSAINKMPLARVEEAIRKTVGYKNVFVNFLGGEPLMVGKQHLMDMFEVAQRVAKEQNQNFKSQLITNGVFVDDEFIQFATENKMSIVMSYDGRGKRHPKTRENLPKLAKMQANSPVFAMENNIHMVVHEQNVDHLLKAVDELVAAGISKVYIAHDVFLERDRVLHYLEKFKEMWDYINDNNLPIYFSYFMDLLAYHNFKKTGVIKYRFQEEFGRYNLAQEVHLYPDGQVRQCLATVEGEYKNLAEYDHFYDYFVSPEYQGYVRAWLESMKPTGDDKIDEWIKYTRGGSTFFFEKPHGGVNLINHNVSNYQMLISLGEYIVSKPINNKYYRKLLG